MSPRITRIRPALQGTALMAAALTAAGSFTGAALAASAAHKVNAATRIQVPFSQVGLGWAIAEYSTASAPEVQPVRKGTTTLYLVSPKGKKFPFFTVPAGSGLNAWNLIDWSGDGQRVLLGTNNGKYQQVSVKTGKIVNRFSLSSRTGIEVLGYTRPHGENILATAPGGLGAARYNLRGKLQVKLAKAGFLPIESPDGAEVIIGTDTGLQILANTGGVIKKLAPPAGNAFCVPIRWWNSKTILTQCNAKHAPAAPRLWLFPANGGKVTALTPQRGAKSHDLGDIDAWKIKSGAYVQALGPCAVEFIARLSGQRVNVPGSNLESDQIITGQGASLLVRPNNGCGGAGSLAWFNPGTKHVTWVLRAAKNIIGAEIVVPFGRPVS